jgi:hypothetical protein
LVARIVDRWQEGEPFEATVDERREADEAIAASQLPQPPGRMEAAYHCRLGRELLRGRQWRRAIRHYTAAVKGDPWNRIAYAGMVYSMLHLGGGPLAAEVDFTEESDTPVAALPAAKHRIGLL